MEKPRLRNVLYSPWMILIFLAVGWGPAFIGDLAHIAGADADTESQLVSWTMGWLGMTVLCSISAIVLTIVHAVQLILRLFRGKSNSEG